MRASLLKGMIKVVIFPFSPDASLFNKKMIARALTQPWGKERKNKQKNKTSLLGCERGRGETTGPLGNGGYTVCEFISVVNKHPYVCVVSVCVLPLSLGTVFTRYLKPVTHTHTPFDWVSSDGPHSALY